MNIEVANLTKTFGSVTAVDGLSLATGDDWRCLGILGRNGAGKSTFLRMLVGLLRPDGGDILVKLNDSEKPYADPITATFIADHCNLIGTLTGQEHFRLYEAMNRLIGVTTDVNLRDELVSRLSLEEFVKKPVRKMSNGTRRKIEVIAAVSSAVPLFVADELTEGLDFPSRVAIEELMQSHALQGKRFVVSSHDLSFITGVSDRIAVIDHGKCVDMIDKATESDLKSRVVAVFSPTPPEMTPLL